jgi:hypothetical protein
MAEPPPRMEKLRETCDDLMDFLDRPRTHSRLGILHQLAVNARKAIGADHLGILIGHLMQKDGKRFTAEVAQSFNRVIADIWDSHDPPPNVHLWFR